MQQQHFINAFPIDTLSVINMVKDVVGSTLGPKGNVVILGNGDKTHTTKDGVSVLRLIRSENDFVNNVINIIREGAENTLRIAGDGTTSTIIIAAKMLEHLKSEKITKEALKDKVKAMLEKIPDIKEDLNDKKAKSLIYTATGGERELAQTILKAYEISEKEDLAMVVEPQIGAENSVEVINGIFFKAKVVSEVFEKKNNHMYHPHVVCYSGTIETEKEVIKAIDKALKMGVKDMIIIANKYTEEALSIMTINQLQGVINIMPLAVAGGDMHNNDIISLIAKALGAEVGGEDLSTRLYDAFTKKYDLCEKFIYENGKAVFQNIKADTDLSEDIEKFKKKMLSSEDDEDLNKYLFLMSMLKRKMVKITIGSNINNKLLELKDRADDTIQSILSAKESGVVKGAGEAYIQLNDLTHDSGKFIDIFSSIRNIVGDVNTEAIDSAKVIEAVISSAAELALLLANTSYVVNIQRR